MCNILKTTEYNNNEIIVKNQKSSNTDENKKRPKFDKI